ncbi:hypothetical protein BAE44_0005155, partial [Dichanthelium oligosanthes]
LDVSGCPGLPPYLERLLSKCYQLCAGLERLYIDDYSFLTASFCKCLTSLQRLELHDSMGEVTRLTDEQERALQLLTSLRSMLLPCRSSCGPAQSFLPQEVGDHSLPAYLKAARKGPPTFAGRTEYQLYCQRSPREAN